MQDAGLVDDCKKAVKTTIDQLGGLDIIISNAVSSLWILSSMGKRA